MSKLQRLRDNIAAIEHALNGGHDREVLAKYSGFGGMNFILNPKDKAYWNKSDLVYWDDTVRLHELLCIYSKDDAERALWLQSLKASTLTAYYTPEELVETIAKAVRFQVSGFRFQDSCAILDPAAGSGVFGREMGIHTDDTYSKGGSKNLRVTMYENDLLTGLILSRRFDGENADVRVKGFETIPDSELGTFDLVSTNVPFGDIAVFDPAYSNSKDAVRREAAKMIHRYYVLKGLDCLRDGGIEAYIITSNYLNRDGEQLAEVLKQSRLIGAYRLANNLFKEAGTEVGTDLLVLQKDSRKDGITAEESMLLTQYEDDGCPTNMYFDVYPEHVIATDKVRGTDAYGKPGFIYTHKDGVAGISKQMSEQLAKDMQEHFDKTLATKGASTERKTKTKHAAKATGTETKKKGCKFNEKMTQEQWDASRKATPKVKALELIYAWYKKLYEYEATQQMEDADLRKALNEKYDEYVSVYGNINSTEPIHRHDVELVSNELYALEVKGEDGTWQKADIFFKPVAFSTEELHEAGTPQEALAQSLNDYGKPDMKYMMAMTGMTEEELLEALDGDVYYDPMSDGYEIKARFVSGNVIEKIDAIRRKFQIPATEVTGTERSTEVPGTERSAKVPGTERSTEVPGTVTKSIDPRVMKSLAALEAAVPTPIPFEDLDFNLGERWIDAKVYGDFGSEFFSMPEDPNKSSYWSGAVEVTVKYNPLLDQYAVSSSSKNEKIWTQFSVSSEATRSLDGIELFIHALQNTCPKMMKYKRDSNGRCMYNDKGEHLKEEDSEKTQLANSKIEEIRQGFQDWLLRRPREWKDAIADAYNRKFNCFVKPRYDGSHQTFPGVDWKGLEKNYGVKSLYQSQKDCIWMLVLNGGGICDHEVGSGKTLIMCMAAHEMKRMGLCHKPMIIGLKANVSAIADTYRTAYPQAKVLYASAKDYSAAERVQFFNQMKNNDWDCIIMSHDQFGRIPQSEEIQLEMLQDEMQQLEDSLRIIKGWEYSLSSRLLKGLERRKRNLGVKIQAVQHFLQERSDDVVDFQMMGIDHIFVDESHQFKNLGFSTRHDRVAGLGNSEGSKRAYNLLMAIRTIQKRTGKDLGATFLSGTTVTNSLTELYSLFRYLRPKALSRQGITCFDAWAAIFTKKSQEFEFSITNQIVLKERFRYFIKVPELAMFYNEITDFRTAEDVGIERPEKHAMLLNIKPTPDQEEFINRLMKFAQNGDFSLIGVEHPTDKQRKAKMLYATDMARKMSLDMRMIDDSYEDHPRSKASRCATLIKRYYDQYNEQKGTQMVFSDLSTYQGVDKGWNVYEEIKRKLIDMGVPAKEIRFIQECKCDSKKQALIKQVNEGKVRVLFGSTSMLGTGVNAQQRVVAVHHLDTPWRPSDLEQRDGRAIRKGNEVARDYADNKVDIIIYAVERSLDSYKFNLLHCKQTFINQLKRGQLNIRTLDEGSFDENTGMNFSEYMAILSGNTDLLERAKLEKKIAALEGERKNFFRDQRETEQRIESLTKINEQHEQHINDAKADLARFNHAVKLNDDGSVYNDLVIDGFSVSDPVGSDEWKKAIGEKLLRIDKSARTQDIYLGIGSIYGFRLLVKSIEVGFDPDGTMEYENKFFVEGEKLKYSYNNGKLNHTSPRISSGMPLQALQHIPAMIAQWETKKEENEVRIEQLQTIVGCTWSKEDDLRNLKAELAKLDRKINEELRSSEKENGEYKQAA